MDIPDGHRYFRWRLHDNANPCTSPNVADTFEVLGDRIDKGDWRVSAIVADVPTALVNVWVTRPSCRRRWGDAGETFQKGCRGLIAQLRVTRCGLLPSGTDDAFEEINQSSATAGHVGEMLVKVSEALPTPRTYRRQCITYPWQRQQHVHGGVHDCRKGRDNV